MTMKFGGMRRISDEERAQQLAVEFPAGEKSQTRGIDCGALLDEAESIICGDRHETYGDAGEDFTRTGKMWAAVLGLDSVGPEQVALCMTLVKIGRLCNTPAHRDSWVDGIGYMALGGQIALGDS